MSDYDYNNMKDVAASLYPRDFLIGDEEVELHGLLKSIIPYLNLCIHQMSGTLKFELQIGVREHSVHSIALVPCKEIFDRVKHESGAKVFGPSSDICRPFFPKKKGEVVIVNELKGLSFEGKEEKEEENGL